MRRPVYLLAVALPLVGLLTAFVPAPLAAADDETVYATRTGSKYHREGCSSLRRSAIPMKLAAAAATYGPCSRCSPPTLKDAARSEGRRTDHAQGARREEISSRCGGSLSGRDEEGHTVLAAA
jgi:hypothetical protein